VQLLESTGGHSFLTLLIAFQYAVLHFPDGTCACGMNPSDAVLQHCCGCTVTLLGYVTGCICAAPDIPFDIISIDPIAAANKTAISIIV